VIRSLRERQALGRRRLPQKLVLVLQDGTYHCKTCVPPIDVKADGEDQPVTGHPYYDTVSMKVVDDRTIEEVDKKSGKTVITSKTVVSPDGSTANFEFTDSSNTNADPVTGKGVMRRGCQRAARCTCNFRIMGNLQDA
jgi:hypothetical protein